MFKEKHNSPWGRGAMFKSSFSNPIAACTWVTELGKPQFLSLYSVCNANFRWTVLGGQMTKTITETCKQVSGTLWYSVDSQ